MDQKAEELLNYEGEIIQDPIPELMKLASTRIQSLEKPVSACWWTNLVNMPSTQIPAQIPSFECFPILFMDVHG